MKEHWHIVPVKDGTVVLCHNFPDGFYWTDKPNSSKNNEVLDFPSAKAAQEIIDNYFATPTDLKPEQFWILGEHTNV